MTWDPSKPADNTKLRLAPGLIRTNWNAIEQGGVPYDYLQLQEQGANPTRADNTGWLYSKQGSSGQSELFYQDDSATAKVIQLTSVGGIGNTNMIHYAQSISFNGVYQNNQTAMITAWGKTVQTGGMAYNGLNLPTMTSGGTGLYSFTTASVFNNANVVILVLPNEVGSGNPVGIGITAGPTLVGNTITFSLGVRDRNGSHTNTPLYVAIIGGI